jgi:dTDP-4-amino-4,6-dideoxygalactose transaminase
VLNPIRYVGAEAVMVDVRSSDHQIDLNQLKEIHRTTPIKAAIIPHRYGHLADLAELTDSGVALIEDGAQSLGATRESAPALQGRVGVYSFYATKMIATGCGGALITDDAEVANFADRVSDYYRPGGMHDSVQYNYRMPDLNAAVGLAQIARLDEFISVRRDLASRYLELLPADVAVVAPPATDGSVWYRFIVRTTAERRAAILKRSATSGCGIGTIDILVDSAAPSFRETLPVSAVEWDRCVSLPIYPGLSAPDQERVAECVRGEA